MVPGELLRRVPKSLRQSLKMAGQNAPKEALMKSTPRPLPLLARLAHLCGLAALCLLHVPAQAADAASPRVGVIGFAAPLANPMAQSALQGAQLAVDEANLHPASSRKGLAPISFQLLAQDDKDNPNTAGFVARYFTQANAIGVVGHWTSAVIMAAAGDYERADTALLNFNATSGLITRQGNKTAFRILGSTDNTAVYLAQAALSPLQGKRVAIIHNNTPFSRTLADSFAARLTQNPDPDAPKVVRQDTVSARTSDFNAALRAAANSGADVIFFAAISEQLPPFVDAARRLHLRARLLLTGGAVNQAMDHDGLIYDLEPDLPPPNCARQRNFLQAYAKRFNQAPTSFARHAYDATSVLIQAARQSDSTTPADVLSALRLIRHSGLHGEIAFDAAGNVAAPGYTLYRSSAQGWQQLRTFPQQTAPTRCPRGE